MDTALKLADEVIEARRSALAEANLQAAFEIHRWSGEDVEIQVEFSRSELLIDVVEDFVVKDGQPVTSTPELRQWLERIVDEVLAEHGCAEGA